MVKTNSLVSVIVPVYNCEKYLDKCINSILKQTYTNLEIILVDDGSTDQSARICDEYAALDNRIKVIHKANGGQSSARNRGLDICSGDFISFIDSDDWIEPDMYALLMEQIEQYHADLAVAGRYDAWEGSDQKTVGKVLGNNGLFSAVDVLPKMAIGQLSDFSVCDKLHKRCLWTDMRFPEGEIYEDFAVMYKVLMAANGVVLCDKPLYNYYHRSNSTVTSGFREALIFYPKQTQKFIEYIEAHYPEYANYAIWTHIKAVQALLSGMLKSDRPTYLSHMDVYETYLRDIRKYRHIWSKDPLFSSRDRLLCRLLLHRWVARMVFMLKTK